MKSPRCHYAFMLCLLIANLASAQQAAPASTAASLIAPSPISKDAGPPTPSTKDRGGKMDAPKAFATGGTKILDSKTGDLNGDGTPDALLVLDPPTHGSEKLGEGPSRIVLLLIRNAGTLQPAAQNDKIVPCAQCGGIAGDPYSYTRIAKNGFTVVTEGGAGQHWSDEYTFAYSAEQRDWLLHEVKREVTDQDTDKQKTLDLTPKDFGTVKFKDFNPSTLPEVELP